MEKNHNVPEAGHFGVYKTLKRIAADYYWPKMRRDVQVFVARCATCLAYKTPTIKPAGAVGRYRVSKPWELIAMDFTGKYPRSPRRNEFLLTVQCLFSKFTLLFPMTNSRAASLVKVLEEKVFCSFGSPEGIICDNGSQFTSREFCNLMQLKNIKIHYTALYHPQADPVERAHRDLKRMMATFMQGRNHSRWDEFVPQFQLAINSGVSEATGFAPASIFFNHRMRESNRELITVNHNDIAQPEEMIAANEERVREVKKYVEENLERQFQKNKGRYDLRHRPQEFKPGDRVWHRNFPLSSAVEKFSKKLAPKFLGPFVVSARHGNTVYSLEDEGGRNVGRWHVQDLLPDCAATPHSSGESSETETPEN